VYHFKWDHGDLMHRLHDELGYPVSLDASRGFCEGSVQVYHVKCTNAIDSTCVRTSNTQLCYHVTFAVSAVEVIHLLDGRGQAIFCEGIENKDVHIVVQEMAVASNGNGAIIPVY
jgi:hypothetical protein